MLLPLNNNTPASHELYQLVTHLAGLGIWERNLTTNAIYCNSIVRNIFEVDTEYVLEPGSLLPFYKNTDLIRSLVTSVIKTGNPEHAEVEVVTAMGVLKWVRIRMHIRSEQNGDKLIYGTLEDITDNVNLQRLIEEREQQFTSAFDNAPIGMALVSLEGSWVKVNKSLCLLLGFKESELYERTFQEITHPEDMAEDLIRMQNLLAGKLDQYNIEKRYYHKDGHTIWAFLSMSLVRDNKNSPLYFISQIKDITERRKNSEIIKTRNAQLLNFAHIVSHNLRSHAGNIQILSEMVVAEEVADEKTLLLSMLTESADKLLETLSQLNEIVKIHDMGLGDRRQLSVIKAVQRVMKILSASIMNENIEINIEVAEKLTVLINPSYLESIFINLLTNSIRYRHPDRPAYISITAYQNASTVIIKLSDNGIGIDMDLHGHKLFGMYKTFHGNKDARGIGLFLIKNQIEAMGGTISAESNIHTGTTFIIELKTDY